MGPTRLMAWPVLLFIGAALLGGFGHGRTAFAAAEPLSEPEPDPFEKDDAPEEAVPPIADPFERTNRALFTFNDRLYFWVLRPVARGYKSVVPEIGRVGIRNFFRNLGTPRRMVNCLLQGDVGGTGAELARFGVNTTVGVAGFGDPAKGWLKLERRDEDFGQTLGVWGLGSGFYIHWPLLGPSSPRDTLGTLADAGLDPATYVPGAGVANRINETSLNLGQYEDLKKSALDPYVAVRDAYNQYRRHAVKTRR